MKTVVHIIATFNYLKTKTMKKLLLVLLLVPMVSLGQMDYYVSAKGGLNVREAPKTSTKESYVKAMISLD